jgi:integrase
MARLLNRLSQRDAANLIRSGAVGKYHDGGGLYLEIGRNGGCSWVLRFTLKTRTRAMGLGGACDFSLDEARERARAARKLIADGVDPIDHRKAVPDMLTFSQCAQEYVADHRAGWKNAKHVEQWQSTLTTYVGPVFGALPVRDVGIEHVVKALRPIWTTKPETATRVRGRIERVLDWAASRKLREGDNPARWAQLKELLPNISKARLVKHHAALPFGEIPAFMGALRTQEGIGALALRFTILTAARTGETIGARWREIDIAEKLWTVPRGRMKAGRENHRVPLSPAALAILTNLKALKLTDSPQEFVFPGGKRGKPLSNMAMTATLRRMGRGDLTVHGFRSTFKDWATECTEYPNEVSEMALAHVVRGKVEAAYRRGDILEKRRSLMDDWGVFLGGE